MKPFAIPAVNIVQHHRLTAFDKIERLFKSFSLDNSTDDETFCHAFFSSRNSSGGHSSVCRGYLSEVCRDLLFLTDKHSGDNNGHLFGNSVFFFSHVLSSFLIKSCSQLCVGANLTAVLNHLPLKIGCLHLGSRDGAVVRALTSHQCGAGSIPSLSVICGWSLLVIYSAPRGFSPGTPVLTLSTG